ncbi:VOC family protein [Flavobacterium silvaticum]|uniref:Glyoxalase n=1 Tax=Flavobacterium silvaticum TaxID=1852020 RepID=A0A972FKB7_9FLAO|nr:VOC family protein [Flavobacterium silvaticum]NMH26800.1 glyoxalase [Flavobacterium silvaticum]
MDLGVREIITFISSGKDYAKSIGFYVDMGFGLEWSNHEISSLKLGNCRFFLQNYPSEWMHGNFMMALEVENVDDWWTKLSSLNLESKYEGVRLKAPQDYPWGKREIHLSDPNGVLWHISSDIRK